MSQSFCGTGHKIFSDKCQLNIPEKAILSIQGEKKCRAALGFLSSNLTPSIPISTMDKGTKTGGVQEVLRSVNRVGLPFVCSQQRPHDSQGCDH